jgi:rhamnosyltransferase
MSSEIKVSICIPTLNGMETLPRLFDALEQQTYRDYEVIVVDSSSSDGTFEYSKSKLKNDPIKILQKDFSHSQTRQYMAGLSIGDIIVFLTQDSIPDNEFWLENLVRPFKDSTIACCFSRHTSRDILPRIRLEEHFSWLLSTFDYPVSIRKNIQSWKLDSNYRKGAHFNSDNSAAYRRDLLIDFPFPRVEYGEDQVWAEQMLNLGYGISFAHDSVVQHWNYNSLSDAYNRGKLEASSWSHYMDYDYTPVPLFQTIAIAFRRYLQDQRTILKNRNEISILQTSFLSVRMNLEVIAFWLGARHWKRLKGDNHAKKS